MSHTYQPQVEKSHYSFQKYYQRDRWMSYWHETNEIVSRDDIKSVLDIGPGSDLLRNILQTFTPDLRYETADIATDVQPDHIGSVTNLPLADNSYDAVCAFQILEHIEFEDVPRALDELQRVSSRYVFISVPHFGPSLELQIKIPFFKRVRVATKLPWPRRHEFAGQHYWELGKRGYPTRRLRALLQERFTVLNEYVPFNNQYHRFFILKL